MLLNFCLGCKKKKLSSSLSDDKLDKESLENSRSSRQTDQVDSNHLTISALATSTKATSPISICKFNNCNKLNEQNPTPVHNLNSDGSVRIKSTAINRALPDLPTTTNNDLVNTSLNSNGSAINRSIDRPQLDRSTPSANSFNNVVNLSLNQQSTTHPNSLIINQLTESNLKFNCISNTTSTFNPPPPPLPLQAQNSTSNLLPLHNNLSESQSQCLNEIRDDDHNKYNKNEHHHHHHKHHSYARIKDNNVVDSSTENDTDDYYDSTIVAKRGLDAQKVTINVPSANINQTSLNSSLNEPQTSCSLYAVSGNLANLNQIQSNLEMPYHISNISTLNNPVSANDSNFGNLANYPTASAAAAFAVANNTTANNFNLTDDEPNKEVSYNKISVREPLSKVLAERAAALIEHHYTEVYDENNSFYEEIAGSTNSSVTYTKIGDIQLTNHMNQQSLSNPMQQPMTTATSPPISIPIETSVLTIRNNTSRSTSPMPALVLQTFLPNSNILSTNNNLSSNLPSTSSSSSQHCEALYSQVNKLTKKNEKFSFPQQQQTNTNDLYAKVQKNLKQSNDQPDNRKIHSSTPDMNNLTSSFKGNAINKEKLPPPPLPKNHPIKSTNLFAIKSNTNLNNQESVTTYSQPYSYQLNVFPQHKRSFSSSSQYQDNDSDYYETFPLSNKSDEDNHGYEVVKKKKNNDKLKMNDDDQFDNEIVDAGYEIINYVKTSKEKREYGSDEDSPCYEVIRNDKNMPSSNKEQEDDDDDYITEPDYEIIKTDKVPSSYNNDLRTQGSENRLRRKVSDVSTSDPGYEQIIHIRPSQPPQTYYNVTNNNASKIDESNEGYEVVGNNNLMDRL